MCSVGKAAVEGTRTILLSESSPSSHLHEISIRGISQVKPTQCSSILYGVHSNDGLSQIVCSFLALRLLCLG